MSSWNPEFEQNIGHVCGVEAANRGNSKQIDPDTRAADPNCIKAEALTGLQKLAMRNVSTSAQGDP